MPIDPLAKRFYVITTFGEVGPVGVDELPGLVEQNRIRTGDMVRSATGRTLGTVADVLEGKVLSSAAVPGSPAVEPPRRRPQSDRHAAGGSAPPNRMPLWIGLGLGICMLLLAMIKCGGGGHPQVRPQADDSENRPEMVLVLGREDEVGNREVLVRAAGPLVRDADVQVAQRGGDAGVRLDPPGGLVAMRAGSDVVALRVLPAEDGNEGRLGLRLVPGSGYRVGAQADLEVAVVMRRRPPSPVTSTTPTTSAKRLAPSIAWEPCDDKSGVWTGSGTGWLGPWSGEGISWCSGALVPGAYGAAFPRREGYIRFSERLDSGNRIFRGLAQRLTSGSVWFSFVARAYASDPERKDFAGLRVCDGRRGKLSIGWNWDRTDGQPGTWFVLPKMDECRDREKKRAVLATDPSQPHLVVVKIHLAGDHSAYRLWVDPPAGREPARESGRGVDPLPPFAIDSVQLYGIGHRGMDLTEIRIGRAWQDVLPP